MQHQRRLSAEGKLPLVIEIWASVLENLMLIASAKF
jgi:hypothetical protein